MEKEKEIVITESMTAEEIASHVFIYKFNPDNEESEYFFHPNIDCEYCFSALGLKMRFSDSEKNVLREKCNDIIRVWPEATRKRMNEYRRKEEAEAIERKAEVEKLKSMLDDLAMALVFHQHGCDRWRKNGYDRLYLNDYPKYKREYYGSYVEETRYIDLNAKELPYGPGYVFGAISKEYIFEIEKRAEQAHIPHQIDINDKETMSCISRICHNLIRLLRDMDASKDFSEEFRVAMREFTEACTPTDLVIIFRGISEKSDNVWLVKRLRKVRTAKPWMESMEAWKELAKTIPKGRITRR